VLTKDIESAMRGIIPSQVLTCSADGVPNITCISQVYYVDPTHVALSYQYFNKTIKNLRENPRACVQVIAPDTGYTFLLQLRFDHSEKEGPIFDRMSMELEAIASMQHMEGVFKLQAADVYEVLSVRKLVEARAR
jgi:predicted pyridoxine 5'-phosphate oxidase superfamily flavin-nucleotide-binding protein